MVFRNLLQEAGYPPQKIQFLYQGFTGGFSLGYEGKTDVQLFSPNLKLMVGNQTVLWNKVMKEVRLKRFAGPFNRVPFKSFIQSPIGLVPKDNGRDTRLIFHLSYPRDGTTSVNGNTPQSKCSVVYKDFDEAVRMCLDLLNGEHNETVFLSKSDADSAFRNLGLCRNSWHWTVLKARSPFDGEWYFFVDKCVPFGASISCVLFQEVSDAVAHLVQFKTKKPLINYLDDYLFAALMKALCNQQMQEFLNICDQIGLPVSSCKTHWASPIMTFLGFLVNGRRKLVMIPMEKLMKANDLIGQVLEPKKRKVTIYQLQKIAGFLNFLCRCVIPGREFTRRIHALINPKLKPHHHVRITGELRMDLRVWEQFLAHPTVFCRQFADFNSVITAEEVDLNSDVSKNPMLGCGGTCGRQWYFQGWDPKFILQYDPSIEYLELYGVTLGVLLWIRQFKNWRICLFCDNQAVVAMVNDNTSSCRNCMVLIRIIVLEALKWNVLVKAKYVRSKDNKKSDTLSRRKFELFHRLSNFTANKNPCRVPDQLWPMTKLWLCK